VSIVFSVDLEDWYQTHDFDINKNLWDNYEDRIEKNTISLLDSFSRNGISAVFFVLGHVAKKHPDLIKEILRNGHEIGSHSMYHNKVFSLTPEEFRADIKESKALLEDITGQKVEYFRAPSWTVNWKTPWFFPILEEEGFKVDSSIQPFKTPLSGMNNVPLEPFRPIVEGKKLGIVEFPSTVFNVARMRIPFSGGFYFRFLPYCIFKQMLKSSSKKRHSMIYIHPWEIDKNQPILESPFHIKMLHYYNISRNAEKIERLLNDFSFIRMEELLKSENFNYYDLDKGYLLNK